MEANQPSTISSVFQSVWSENQELEALKQPVTWLALNQFIQERAREEEDIDMAELDNFEKSILKITRAWYLNLEKWQINSYSDLMDKAGKLLLASFRMSLSSTMMENVLAWSSYCIQQELITEEICSGLLPMLVKTTSMSSTTVRTPTVAADAPGEVKSSLNFQDVINKLSEKDGVSHNSAAMTGSMSSYITHCESGESPVKYGLNEKIKDYRLHMSLYDGKKCKENPQKFWLGITDGFQITYSKKDKKIREAVQTLLDQAGSMYAGKQLNLITSSKKYRPY